MIPVELTAIGARIVDAKVVIEFSYNCDAHPEDVRSAVAAFMADLSQDIKLRGYSGLRCCAPTEYGLPHAE